MTSPLATTVALRQPLDAIREQVTTADALGYHSVWLPEITDRDALVLAATLAPSAGRILLATGVVPLGSRSLPLLAMAALTAGEASAGRLWLGVGAGHAEISGPWHDRRVPVGPAQMRTAVQELRALMAGQPGDRRFRVRSYGATPPPVLIGGLSEGMMRVAGEVADGVLLNWVTVDRARGLAAAVRRSAERAGRDPATLTVASYLPVAVTGDPAPARRQLARQVAAYVRLAAYRRGLERAGWGQQVDQAISAGPGAPDAVPGDLLDALGVIGSRAMVTDRIDELRAAGVDLPVLAPVIAGEDPWGSMVATWTELAPAR